MEGWRVELDKRKVIRAVAMDLSKVFDYLPHKLLLKTLKFYGSTYEQQFSGTLTKLFVMPISTSQVGPYLLHLDGCVGESATVVHT